MTNRGGDGDYFQAVLDDLPTTAYVYDLDRGVNVYANRRWYEEFGYSEAETRGRGDFLTSVLHPDDVAHVAAHHAAMRQRSDDTELVVEYRARKKSGQWVWLESRDRVFSRAPDGRALQLVGTAHDVTQRKFVGELSRDAEARFRAIVEHHPDAVFIARETGEFVEVNGAACSQLGYTRDELLRLRVQDIVPPEVAAGASERLRQGAARGFAASAHVRKDGTHVPVEIALVPISLRGQPAMLGVARDITDRLRLETQLREAQRLEAIGRLAGAVAHDFNNLLAGILGAASLLADSPALETGDRQLAEEIMAAAERGGALTQQMLTFSKQHRTEMRTIDLSAHIADVLKVVRRLLSDFIAVETEIEPGCIVHGDPGMLDQVVMNLAVNARDAMPNGGTLRIELRRGVGVGDVAECASRPPIKLRVADTGVGIPPEVVPRIFEPFFTTKSDGKGTGLGLSTVYGIVTQHGGTVSVESEVDRGTTFSVCLPAAAEDAATVTTPSAPERTPPLVVLLVDDNPVVRKVTCRMLQGLGHEVLTVGSAEEALDLLEAGGHRASLLLSDIALGSGMNGAELAARVLGRDGGLPVLLMSGYDESMKTLPPGCAFLQKPFRQVDLQRALNESIARAEVRALG